jgi:hypothetical protein
MIGKVAGAAAASAGRCAGSSVARAIVGANASETAKPTAEPALTKLLIGYKQEASKGITRRLFATAKMLWPHIVKEPRHYDFIFMTNRSIEIAGM